METLSTSSIAIALESLNGWSFVENALEKKLQFNDFKQALGFIVQVGLLAEKQNHHPELWNVYNKVSLRLSTHDANGVTQKDIDLANAIDKIP
jgi:4a-hydroxytetrahydrobiopterin dehydratase